MASSINISALSLNPIEADSIGKFVIAKTLSNPALASMHSIYEGITMKEQIVFASQLGLTGIKDTSCARPNSGAQATLTQKFWEPANVGDTLVHCNADVNALFKAYFAKIQKYVEKYDISGSDLEKLLMVLLTESVTQTVWRIAWLGDKNVAASGAATAGLKDVANVKYYDHIEGLFDQIFAGVTAGDIKHTTTKVAALNALITTAGQTTLAAGDARAVFEDMWLKADSRLRSDSSAYIGVTRELWENYRQDLQAKGENSSIVYTMEGFPSLSWNGLPVINCETIWDLRLRADFEQDSTNHAYYLPNRAVLTVPTNVPIGTLNSDDMTTFEIWYNQDDRVMKTAYGFTLDAKVLEPYMIVAAY